MIGSFPSCSDISRCVTCFCEISTRNHRVHSAQPYTKRDVSCRGVRNSRKITSIFPSTDRATIKATKLNVWCWFSVLAIISTARVTAPDFGSLQLPLLIRLYVCDYLEASDNDGIARVAVSGRLVGGRQIPDGLNLFLHFRLGFQGESTSDFSREYFVLKDNTLKYYQSAAVGPPLQS